MNFVLLFVALLDWLCLYRHVESRLIFRDNLSNDVGVV